jgi:hypothetical protein
MLKISSSAIKQWCFKKYEPTIRAAQIDLLIMKVHFESVLE